MIELNFLDCGETLKHYQQRVQEDFNKFVESVDWDNFDIRTNREYYIQLVNQLAEHCVIEDSTPPSKKLLEDYNTSLAGVAKAIRAMPEFDNKGMSEEAVVYSMLWRNMETTISMWLTLDDSEDVLLHLLGARASRWLNYSKVAGTLSNEEELSYANEIRNIIDKYDEDRYGVMDLMALTVIIMKQQYRFCVDNYDDYEEYLLNEHSKH